MEERQRKGANASRTSLRPQSFVCENCCGIIAPGASHYNAVQCFGLSGHAVNDLSHAVFCSQACALSAAVRKNGTKHAPAMWARYCGALGTQLPMPPLVRKDARSGWGTIATPTPPRSTVREEEFALASKILRPASDGMQD